MKHMYCRDVMSPSVVMVGRDGLPAMCEYPPRSGEAVFASEEHENAISCSSVVRQPLNNLSITSVSRRYHIGLVAVWKYAAYMLLAFFVAVGNVWGESSTLPTSGTLSNGVTKYELSNTTSVVNNNKIYWAARGSVSKDANYGLRPYQTGFVVSVSGPVKLTFNVKSNTTSSRTITGQAYVMSDALYYVWKNTSAGNSLEEYVKTVNAKAAASRTDEEAAIAANSKLKNITSSSDNNKKLLTGETADAALETAHRRAISHNCPTTKLETNSFADTLSAAGNYLIYLTSSGGTVGLTTIDVDPLYPVRTSLTNVTKTSGDTLAGATGSGNADYSAVFAASEGYVLPSTITVTIGGSAAVLNTDYTWNSSTGAFAIIDTKATGVIAVTITGEAASGCSATAPGAISKGEPSAGVLTLTAEGSVASGDTWYWQTAADGEDDTDAYDAVNGKEVSAAGTYYLRSYNTTGTCWSSAKSVTVAAEDLLTPITPSLSYDAMIVVEETASPTLTGNAGSGSVTYALNDVTPAGCMTIVPETGVVTAVAAGTATVTATIAASGYYAGNTATSGTIKVVAAPTHLVENRMATGGTAWDSYILTNNAHISNLVELQAAPEMTLIKKATSSTGRTIGITSTSGASLDEDEYIYLQFTIESGYELTLSEINIPVFSISKLGKYVARIADNAATPNVIETEELSVSDATDGIVFDEYDFSSSPKLTGTVTLKLFAYGWGDGYRMKSPVYIDGTISEARVVSGTAYDLTAVAINDAAISTENLATLKTADAYALDVATAYATAPTVKFSKQTTISYTEGDPDVNVDVISVTAAENAGGKWEATATIGTITYTVTMAKATTYTVNYKDEDGTTDLGSEIVAVDSHPTASEITATKDYYTFASWKQSDAAVALSDVSAAAGETVTLVASYTPAYATSINIEQWVLDNKKDNSSFRAVLDARNYQYANLNDLDSLRADKNESDRNYPYLGQKWKLATSEISFLLKNGSTVKARLGNVGSSVNVVIGTADPVVLTSEDYANASTSSAKEYSYTATADVVVKFQGTGTGTTVIKQIMIDDAIATVKLPAVVTLDANGGTYSDASVKYTGTPLVIGDATPADPTGYDFEGWHVGSVEGAKIDATAYEPAKNVTLVAKYVVKASTTDLDALTYSVDGGAATAVGYSAGTYTYNVVLPYGSYTSITVAATPITGATIKDDATKVLEVTSLPGSATFTVVGSDAAEQLYTVNFAMAAKDGVSIIETKVTGQTSHGEVTGYIGGTAEVKVASNYKLNTGNYVGVTLAGSNKFQTGDVVVINVTNAENATGFTLYTTNDEDSVLIIDTRASSVIATGIHTVTIPATYPDGITPYEGTSSIYLLRANNSTTGNMNARVDSIAVLRAMNPVLTAIQFNSTDVEVTSTTVAATLPNGTNLGTMTVTPTIYWSGAGTSVVTTNAGAWAWGDNTYRVTDKDGDYTDYMITLTEALAPSATPVITTQPADGIYYEGVTIDALEVVATGESLTYQWYLGSDEIDGATAATYTPTVSTIGSYEYHCVVTNTEAGHPATSLASDDATITITENPAAIKLVNKTTGAINTTQFTTAVTANEDVNGEKGAEYTSARSTLSSISALGEMVQYNATTNKAKIKLEFYNTSSAAKTAYLFKLEEGEETADVIEIPLDGSAPKTTEYYSFDSEKNRSFYVTVSDKKVQISQITVIDNGETAMKQFGQVGYSLNMNKGRMFAKNDGSAYTFEGASIRVSSDYKILNNNNLATKSYIQFTNATANTVMKVTRSGGNYYVSQDPEDKGTIYNTNQEIVLDDTTDPWYIGSQTSGSAASFTKIEFIAPKCEAPVFNSLANSDICAGDPYVALNGTGTVSDGGSITYKWYAQGDAETVLATTATYTPAADGNYYVVATNSLADHSDNAATSDVVTVTTYAAAEITTAPANVRKDAGVEATLTVVATGKGLHYTWKECATIDGTYTDVAGAADAASLNITVPSGVKYYKVVVSSACGDAVEAIAKVEEWTELPQANVTASTTWDWNNAVEAADESSVPSSGATITGEAGAYVVLANVEHIHLGNDFKSDALVGKEGQNAWRSTTYKAFQGAGAAMLKFHVEKAGRVRLFVSSTNSNTDTEWVINSTSKVFQTTQSRRSAAIYTDWVEVPADADVEIGTGTAQSMRIYMIEYQERVDQRGAGWVRAGELGTVCLKSDAFVTGANLYELQGLDEYGKLAFDQILSGELEAGKPYLFEATSNALINFYAPVGAETTETAGETKGMYGTFVAKTFTSADESIYYFSGTHIYGVKNFTVEITIPAYLCYMDMDVLRNAPAADPTPAPGRRRVTMGVQGAQVTTGMEDASSSSVVNSKIIIDGRLYILRGEKMYDATGKLVK